MLPALPRDASTLLVISAVGLPLYSARGLRQTIDLATIGAQLRRTVNGKLVNLAPPQFQKYHTKITGSDQEPPAMDGVFAGAEITIECIAEIAAVGGAMFRPAASGSIRVDGDFVFYRPILDMLVTAFTMDSDEWAAGVGWTLDAEEV